MDLILLLVAIPSLLFMLYPYIAYSSIEAGRVLKVGEEWSSPHGTFALGFRSVPSSKASFNLAIWYQIDEDKTMVWVATNENNGQVVQVSGSPQLQLQQGIGLAVTDEHDKVVWQPTSTLSFPCCASVSLLETGNLVVHTTDGNVAWQSFDHPTTTILPGQQFRTPSALTQASLLSPSQNYALHINRVQAFLLNHDRQISGAKRYWYIQNPDFNKSITCLEDDDGNQVNAPRDCMPSTLFSNPAVLNLSSQGLLTFYDATGNITWYRSPSENPRKYALDYGDPEVLMRRLTLDDDGNLKIYSFINNTKSWRVSWQALLKECDVYGICGPFGLCSYRPHKTCSCPPGFHHIDPQDVSKGCDYDVQLTALCAGHGAENKLVLVARADYYYNDYDFEAVVTTLEDCKRSCLQDCKCLAAAYKPSDSLCFHKGNSEKIYMLKYGNVNIAADPYYYSGNDDIS